MKTMNSTEREDDGAPAPQRRRLLQAVVAGAGWVALRGAFATSSARGSLDACLAAVDGEGRLADAYALSGEAGAFRLHLRGACVAQPLRLEACYGELRHRFWQAWQHDGAVHHAAPVSIGWVAEAGEALPLVVSAGGRSTSVALPARAGRYVLALDGNGRGTSMLRGFGLRRDVEPAAGLISLHDMAPAPFPHFVLDVAAATG